MGLLKEDVLHLKKDLDHIHDDFEHMVRDLGEHKDCESYQHMIEHVKDLDTHVHDHLAHVGHIETKHA